MTISIYMLTAPYEGQKFQSCNLYTLERHACMALAGERREWCRREEGEYEDNIENTKGANSNRADRWGNIKEDFRILVGMSCNYSQHEASN